MCVRVEYNVFKEIAVNEELMAELCKLGKECGSAYYNWAARGEDEGECANLCRRLNELLRDVK